MQIHYFTVEDDYDGKRLDKFISSNLPDLSRVRVQDLIGRYYLAKTGDNSCDIITDRAYRVKSGEEYIIRIPPAGESNMQAADIPLHIVFEDDDMLVVDKQAGLVVHPGVGNLDNTLANALMHHCRERLSVVGGVMRPGIVHRLDKDTSGLILVAKSDIAHKNLADQIRQRSLRRVYNAVVWGVVSPPAGKVDVNIGVSSRDHRRMTAMKSSGKPAVTHYKTLEVFGDNIASLVECRLETGRTHQIRVHMNHIGCPVVGDPVYGSIRGSKFALLAPDIQEFVKNFPRQALHAVHIAFTHPQSGEYMEFHSNIGGNTTKDMESLLQKLRNG